MPSDKLKEDILPILHPKIKARQNETKESAINKLYYPHSQKNEYYTARDAKKFIKMAKRGSIEGQYNLGYCYYNGEGVIKNHTEAVRLWRKAFPHNRASTRRA